MYPIRKLSFTSYNVFLDVDIFQKKENIFVTKRISGLKSSYMKILFSLHLYGQLVRKM